MSEQHPQTDGVVDAVVVDTDDLHAETYPNGIIPFELGGEQYEIQLQALAIYRFERVTKEALGQGLPITALIDSGGTPMSVTAAAMYAGMKRVVGDGRAFAFRNFEEALAAIDTAFLEGGQEKYRALQLALLKAFVHAYPKPSKDGGAEGKAVAPRAAQTAPETERTPGAAMAA